MTLHIGTVTDEERGKVGRLTRARSAPVRLVTRARMVQLAIEGLTAPAIARELGVSEKMVRIWLKRFALEGVAGLDDARRSGRPRTYTEAVYSQVVAKARGLPPKPAVNDEEEVAPTCHWTLDRLQSELAKDGLPIKRSQIRRILHAEHIKWQKPRTWLDSDDPEFAEKRGPSSRSTRSHPPVAR
jgi:transposase